MATSWRSRVELPPALGSPGGRAGRAGGAAPASTEQPAAPVRLAAWRVLAFAAVVPLLLRMKLPRLARWLEPAPRPPSPVSPASPAPPDAAALAALVGRIDRLLAAGRPLVRRGCLTRGLTLYRFLRRADADVALCFGIGKQDGDLAGHCWIEHEGAPLAERRDPRELYVETYRISRTAGGEAGGAASASAPETAPDLQRPRRTPGSRFP
jgi:Transglutaminase-like superfamily